MVPVHMKLGAGSVFLGYLVLVCPMQPGTLGGWRWPVGAGAAPCHPLWGLVPAQR